jgi:group I intron endonuclease
MTQASGIYQIICIVNNKLYVGSALNLCMRKSQHFSSLKKGKGVNRKLQNAFNKYGMESFVFSVIEECEPSKLIEREQHYFDTLLKAKEEGDFFEKNSYNIRRICKSNLGVSVSKETRKKLSDSQKGRVVTEDVRKRTSETLKGRKHTPKRVKKMVENKTKTHHTEDSKDKIGLNCPHRRPIVQIDKKTNQLIREWRSAEYARSVLGLQHISCVCRGVRKTAGGYKWKFKDEYES